MCSKGKSITVLYFASLGERLGQQEEKILLSETTRTLQDLITFLGERGANWNLLKDNTTKCAINQTIAPLTQPIENNDEVAFFPPVTGG